MLLVPYVVGLVTFGFRWPDVPLLAAAIAGYGLSYYLAQAIKSRRHARYQHQIVVYGSVAVPVTVIAILASPALLRYAPVYAVLFAVNGWYARRRRDRSLANGIASVVQCCVIVFAVGTVAGAPPADALPAFALCLGYFVGTVLYVKTMIRERDSRAFLGWSTGFHAVALVVAAVWLGLPAAIFFGWLLLRAAIFPRRRLSPKQVGIVEIVSSVALVVVAALMR
jgi:hypothetical protein